MFEFRPLTKPCNFALLVSVHHPSPNETYVRRLRIDNNYKVEKIPSQSLNNRMGPSQWSHAIYFAYEHQPYVFYYDTSLGNCNILPILSSYQKLIWSDKISVTMEPGYTHLLNFHKMPVLMFYNEISGKFLLLEIPKSNKKFIISS